mmetsp:Transcript_40202/g.66735  ORF Transcript_40202/g.66735 Transcript_40202/m.66735 type:complete len:81 (+) Transcript_40202:330-572(+)
MASLHFVSCNFQYDFSKSSKESPSKQTHFARQPPPEVDDSARQEDAGDARAVRCDGQKKRSEPSLLLQRNTLVALQRLPD